MRMVELDWESMDPPGPVTESTRERGLDPGEGDAELGESEELDEDNVGDIADEGPGHRG